ncbi:MAG: hypothetical protein ABI910_11955 [Gemmatimonadota bacterium]
MVDSLTHRWRYSAAAIGRPATQLEQDAMIERLRARGRRFERFGNARTI